MRLGITLNEVIRGHYETVDFAYEMYTRDINEKFTEYTDLENHSIEEKNPIASDLLTEEQKKILDEANVKQIEPLKVFDLTNNSLDEAELLEAEELSLEIERAFIEISDSEDPMGLTKMFKFKDHQEFVEFLYQDQAFEIFSRTPLTYSKAMFDLDELYSSLTKKGYTITIVSQERENSKPATLLFLAQNNFKGNNIKFLYDYSKIWELYDIIITADPYIIKTKPEKKICLKIVTEQNKEIKGDRIFEFNSINDINNYFKKQIN
jgi:hypothetical protein